MTADEQVNQRWDRFVQETISNLAAKPGDWANLADVRKALYERGTRQAAQDDHLTRMILDGKIDIRGDNKTPLIRWIS
jgi:hypothetical protein